MSEDKAQNTFYEPEKCGEKVRKVPRDLHGPLKIPR